MDRPGPYALRRRSGENIHLTPSASNTNAPPTTTNSLTTSQAQPDQPQESQADDTGVIGPILSSNDEPAQGGPSTPIYESISQGPSTAYGTTMIPITTVTQDSTTFTSFSASETTPIPRSIDISTLSSSFLPIPTSPLPQDGGILVQTCAGSGFDAAATGILTAVIVPGLLGLGLWITFAMLRPRFRQIYALREWFVQESLRSPPLGSGFFAWLFPPVPLVPSVPDDVSDAGRSASKDAKLFPSDEQLSQRALFVSLLIAIGWSVLALGGALPLYIIGTPCNEQVPSPAEFGGGYSTLMDLSLMRLLRLIDNDEVSVLDSSSLTRRALEDDTWRSRTRVIVLTVMAIVLGVLPALWKILREFNKIVEYRKRWIEVKCDNQDLGWLSATKAPGFAHWGEKQFKDYLSGIGLSSQLNNHGRKRTVSRKSGRSRRRGEEEPLQQEDLPEVDIQCLFSITDTEALAMKLWDREEILDNLEMAETKYISSFRVTTPDPSVLDFVPSPPPDQNRPYISRPLPLAPQRRSHPKRAINRAYGASSFVAPSSFYKLRGLRGVSGGRFTDSGLDQSLGDSIHSRVIGSRFMEVNRNSQAYGRLPLGVHVGLERDGQLGPVSDGESWLPPIPDPRYYGPNYAPYESEGVDEHGVRYTNYDGGVSTVPEQTEEEWVDLIKENPTHEFGSDYNGTPPSSNARRPRPPPKDYVPSSRRETFPLRPKDHANPDSVPPPHLRLQPQQPYVLPVDGVNFDDLGEVYSDINRWRVQLKNINAEIAEIQEQKYQDIANGEAVKGWLMTGKNLRFIPGVELIEGRAKEDIRWDVLQNERTGLDSILLWAIVIVVMVLLAAGLTAASGLSLALAPDVAHYLPFLSGLFNTHPIAAGIATVFAPATAASIFIALALYAINWSSSMHGSVSISGNQLLVFKIIFFAMAFVGTVWLVAIGSVLYSMRALDVAVGETKSLANGSIYMTVLALALVINVAILLPACLLLQPIRLWRVLRAERESVTPRQRFRATFPRTYNPSYAMAACILAVVFASTFSLIFPLIAPAVVIFLLLTLTAHRFLVGYVYVRTHSQTGGVLQIWLLKRFGTLLSFQPILLGLIFMSRHIWIEGGILAGTGVAVIIFVESYCAWKIRQPGHRSLNANTRHSIEQFMSAADNYLNVEKAPSSEADDNGHPNGSDGTTTVVNHDPRRANGLALRAPGMRTRGSFASVLEIMSQTVAVVPSSSIYQGAVPLDTENLNDLTATERAARTHPDAPPRLPPLPFTEHADEMSGILYAPELVSPPPIIWLPNDSAGVARSEAEDLQKYHDLQVTLDVRAKEDVLLRRSLSSRRRPS